MNVYVYVVLIEIILYILGLLLFVVFKFFLSCVELLEYTRVMVIFRFCRNFLNIFFRFYFDILFILDILIFELNLI